MSSTNRGAERRIDDAYETPTWCVRRLREAWQPLNRWLVEPCVGSGQIVKCFADYEWHTCDVRELDVAPSIRHVTGDFLACVQLGSSDLVGAVVTNPPFSLAEEFVRHSRRLYPNADLVFLLRLNFAGSAGRLQLWRDVGMPDVYVLPNRPSFTGGKTDSCEYAWFRWPAEKRELGTFLVLNETPRSER